VSASPNTMEHHVTSRPRDEQAVRHEVALAVAHAERRGERPPTQGSRAREAEREGDDHAASPAGTFSREARGALDHPDDRERADEGSDEEQPHRDVGSPASCAFYQKQANEKNRDSDLEPRAQREIRELRAEPPLDGASKRASHASADEPIGEHERTERKRHEEAAERHVPEVQSARDVGERSALQAHDAQDLGRSEGAEASEQRGGDQDLRRSLDVFIVCQGCHASVRGPTRCVNRTALVNRVRPSLPR
jgi:hypothetical protein